MNTFKDFNHQTDFNWTDISSEQERTYQFPGDEKVVINQPIALAVSSSGGHRLFDSSGRSHYIPAGWIALSWVVKEGQPHFVK